MSWNVCRGALPISALLAGLVVLAVGRAQATLGNRRLEHRSGAFGAGACAVLLVFLSTALTGAVAAPLAASTPPTFAGPKAYATGRIPVALVVADVNGDRKPDLATGNYGENENSVSVLINTGRGSFRTARDYIVGEAPGALAIGDLDGDRRPDLAAANELSNTVSVLLNSGDGTFGRRTDYPTADTPFAVAIGDLNSDGSRDLAIVNVLVHSVSVLLNDGDGSFRPKVDYRTGRRPQEIVVGDLTGDGNLDLATGNRSDTVSVLVNRGDGTFEGSLDYQAGSGPRGIAIGDLNGDRRPDLVTANTNVDVHTLSVFINGGGGNLRPKRDYRTGPGAESVAIGDLTGDGRPDLATANNGEEGSTVSVLVNKGRGAFLPRRDYRTGRLPWSVAISDLNGDSRRDVATANYGGNSVSVLTNTTGLCTMPKITGTALAAAKKALARANCRVGTIRRAYSNRVARGRVISATPKAGMVLPRRGTVSIVVSRGPRR
jgi:hypothetical protein